MIQNLKFKVIFSSLLTAVLAISFACSSSQQTTRKFQKNESKIVGSVGDTSISYQKLLDQYKNSNPDKSIKHDTSTYRDLSNFLNLYLDYRAKILEAKRAGYYQQKSIKDELNQYAKQYAYTFWMDKKIRQELLDTLIARSQWEVHASHILIALPPQASPEDTLKAWNKLMEARHKFQNGESFSKLINEYSTKRNGRPMGGDLGYIEAGWVIKPFEDVAYNTPVDSVSMPVRSRFGYHLIYVQGRRKHKPERMVSHIFFRTRGKGHSIKEAMDRADSVYQKLQSGVSWNKLVGLSEDQNSRLQNGKIGWIDRNRLQPTFTDTVYSIKKIHRPYHPFYSGYGVHIVKIDSIRTFKSKKQQEKFWLARLKQLPRYKNNKPYILEHIKDIGHAKIFADNYADMAKILDKQDTLNPSEWSLSPTLLAEPIYQINYHTDKVSDFFDWLKKESNGKQNVLLYPEFVQFQNAQAEKQLIPLTEQNFPNYKKAIQHYLNGLVVYKITDDSVWNYAQHDTTALHNLFASDSSKYWFPTRYKYYRIAADSDAVLNLALNQIRKGISPDSLGNHFKKLNLIVRKNEVSELDDKPYDHLKGLKPGESTAPFSYQGKRTILYLSKILKPAPMSFDEAYNQLVTDYQPLRQKEWIESLRKRYHIHAYPDRLHEKFWSDQMNN